MTGYRSDPADWNPPNYPAVNVWLCGRCSAELLRGNDYLTCETCGSRYDLDTGTPAHLAPAGVAEQED